MKYYIKEWHGRNDKLYERIKSITSFESNNSSERVFNGTLEDFQNQWKDKFLYTPEPTKPNVGYIWVTHRSNFGMA